MHLLPYITSPIATGVDQCVSKTTQNTTLHTTQRWPDERLIYWIPSNVCHQKGRHLNIMNGCMAVEWWTWTRQDKATPKTLEISFVTLLFSWWQTEMESTRKPTSATPALAWHTHNAHYLSAIRNSHLSIPNPWVRPFIKVLTHLELWGEVLHHAKETILFIPVWLDMMPFENAMEP